MNRSTPKPKTCPCGIKFTPRGLGKYHSPACELKFKTGRVEDEQLQHLHVSVLFLSAKGKFQSWIKKRDEGKPCISCNKTFTKSDLIHAGHLFKAELHSWLIFNEDNCHAQCEYCNTGLEGNFYAYRDNLPIRIGAERAAELTKLAGVKQYNKFSKEELIETIKKYKG